MGAFGTFAAFHDSIKKENIFRVAHDLDPIPLLGTYPYTHVNPSPRDPNNFTLPSPSGELFSTANHDMNLYITSVGAGEGTTSDTVRGFSQKTDNDNAVLAKWLLPSMQAAKRVHRRLMATSFLALISTTFWSLAIYSTPLADTASGPESGYCQAS